MACSGALIVGEVVLCLGTLLSFVSSITVFWKWFDSFGVTIQFGLYIGCIDVGGARTCDSMEDPEGYVFVVRALMSVAVLLGGISVLVSFVHLYKVSKRTASKVMVTAIVSMCVIAVLFQLLAAIIYGVNYKEEIDVFWGHSFNVSWDLGTSFYLNIVSLVLLLMAASLVWKSFTPDQVQPQTGMVFTQRGGGTQPVYFQPGQHPSMAPNYGQPVYYGHHQPQPYVISTNGQPMAPGYPNPQPYGGMAATTNININSANGQNNYGVAAANSSTAGSSTINPMPPAYGQLKPQHPQASGPGQHGQFNASAMTQGQPEPPPYAHLPPQQPPPSSSASSHPQPQPFGVPASAQATAPPFGHPFATAANTAYTQPPGLDPNPQPSHQM